MLKWILIVSMLLSAIAKAGEPAIYVETLIDAIALSETIKKDVLVIFTADWCQYCQKLKNDINRNPSIVEDKIICYIDKDNNKDLIKEYKVKSIPDYLILRDNIEIARQVGYYGKDELVEWLKNVK